MDVNLIMFQSDGQRRDIALQHHKTVLGRGDDVDLQIPVATVSRKHCALTIKEGTLAVRDLGSSNGTFVNGSRVVEATLSAGDNLKIGPVIFTVQIDGSPAEVEVDDSMLLLDDAANPVEHANASALVGSDERAAAPSERPPAKVRQPVRAVPVSEPEHEPEEPEIAAHAAAEPEAALDNELPLADEVEEASDPEPVEEDIVMPIAEEPEEEEEAAEELPNDPLSALAAMTRKKGGK